MIDVIIPVYNVKKYLKRSIKCWRDQTLNSSIFNVYYIDDGSTDGTFDFLTAETSNDKNIFVIKQKNSGAAKARQKGFNSSNGDWIIYIDGDGYVNNGYLKSFSNKISPEIDLIFSDNYRYIYENQKLLTISRAFGQFFINGWYNLNNRTDVGDTTNKMWRRSAVDEVEWQNFKRGEDWVYFSKCMMAIRKNAYKKVRLNNNYIDFFGRKGSSAEISIKNISYLQEQYDAQIIAANLLKETNHKMSKYLSKKSNSIANSTLRKIKEAN